ncbi:MAG: helix-turn-helix domain-containing protein [Maledivibacter sp.]|jgi:DNA-binding XRE family transcriptional regulator|nr:helix-turn-helix domain-containing protein [Maledivibacter sp.]
MNSNKLKGLRVGRGYTQEKISKKIGITTKTYNRKELGFVEFNCNEISKIAEILEMSLQSVNEIFFESKLTNRLTKDTRTA